MWWMTYLGNDLSVEIHRQAILSILVDRGVDASVHGANEAFSLTGMPVSTNGRIALPLEEPWLITHTHWEIESDALACRVPKAPCTVVGRVVMGVPLIVLE